MSHPQFDQFEEDSMALSYDENTPLADEEEWKTIDGWCGKYEVSSHGNVRSTRKTLKPILDPYGYLNVCLSDVKRNSKRIHVLVAAAFIGKRPDGLVINHVDSNKRNNRVDNLEYCTVSQNALHGIASGNGRCGEGMHWAKLKAGDVTAIKIMRDRFKMTATQIAPLYGVVRTTVSQILCGTTWKSENATLVRQ